MTVSQAIDPIRVEGLRELQAALRAVDGQAQKQLRLVLNDAANIVVRGAQSRAPVRSGAYRDSIRASSGQREAKVSGGSSKVAYAGWIDFGGAVGRNRSVKRPFIKVGRYVYPTYYDHKVEILEKLNEGLAKLIVDSGLVAD